MHSIIARQNQCSTATPLALHCQNYIHLAIGKSVEMRSLHNFAMHILALGNGRMISGAESTGERERSLTTATHACRSISSYVPGPIMGSGAQREMGIGVGTAQCRIKSCVHRVVSDWRVPPWSMWLWPTLSSPSCSA